MTELYEKNEYKNSKQRKSNPNPNSQFMNSPSQNYEENNTNPFSGSLNAENSPTVAGMSPGDLYNMIMTASKQSVREVREEFNQRIDNVEKRLGENDERMGRMEEQMQTMKDWVKTLETSGNRGTRTERILHLRGWLLSNGKPVVPELGALPDEFYRAVEDVEHVTDQEYVLHMREGWTYFQVGWLIANNWAMFTRIFPQLDLRSRTEQSRKVGKTETRFFKDKRTWELVKLGRNKTPVPNF